MHNLKWDIINGLADPLNNGEVHKQIREYLVGLTDIIQTLKERNSSFYGAIVSPTLISLRPRIEVSKEEDVMRILNNLRKILLLGSAA